MSNPISRRAFTASAAALGALATTARAADSDRKIRMGFVGLGNRGDQVLSAFLPQPDAEIVALCDVYEPYALAAQSKAGGKPRIYRDYRELLAQSDVDAVVIATPDHWHALQFIDACRAGKDVYVEKPLSLTIAEGQRMVEVAEETKRVTLMGTQRRSSPLIQEMVRLIQDGAIGKVSVAKCYHLVNESPMGIGKPADGDPPPGLDWDFWLGPAPQVAFNTNRCLYKFRWFWNYSGGQLTNMGTHYLDLIQWALGQDAPTSVVASGGNYVVQDNREIPDTMEVVWEYPGGTLVTFSQYNGNAAASNPRDCDLEFRGSEGTLYYRQNSIEIVPERVRTQELAAQSPIAREANRKQGESRQLARKEFRQQGAIGDELHARNFLDCVKSRQPTNCPVAVGHRSTSVTLLGNIAYKTGRKIRWDAARQECLDDAAANALLTYEYRAPWRLS
ncbi:MAG: Gfo/Idh/MocA family oxidoreductase [Pirellulales bacterium]|nr:Gfo/Idh/MocA family oxidoreductase [Pirellulales bacterium]